jgi:hypothetical protein
MVASAQRKRAAGQGCRRRAGLRCRAVCHCGVVLLRLCDRGPGYASECRSRGRLRSCFQGLSCEVWEVRGEKGACRQQVVAGPTTVQDTRSCTGLNAPEKGSMVQINLVGRLTSGKARERPEMSVGGAAKAREKRKRCCAVGTGKGFTRAVWSSRAHIKSQPWWRAILEAAQWVAGPLSALTTPACAGCFRRSISADVKPRQEVIVAQFTTLSLSVSVARGCAGNLTSGSRCTVGSAASTQTRALWRSPRAWSNCFTAPHCVGNIKPHQASFLQTLHTVTLNRPPRLEIISESQKGCPNLHPHSRACQ